MYFLISRKFLSLSLSLCVCARARESSPRHKSVQIHQEHGIVTGFAASPKLGFAKPKPPWLIDGSFRSRSAGPRGSRRVGCRPRWPRALASGSTCRSSAPGRLAASLAQERGKSGSGARPTWGSELRSDPRGRWAPGPRSQRSDAPAPGTRTQNLP